MMNRMDVMMKDWKGLRLAVFVGVFVVLVLGSGCSQVDGGAEEAVTPDGGMGMEHGNGMMARHHGEVPEAYAGLTNPVAADDESLASGAAIYTERCATCHGDYGNGDGPGGAALDPAPAAISHTSQMLSDGHLFWRISEGGAAFGTGMLPFGELLTEGERWDVINYVRALGSGRVQPGTMMGGEPFDQSAELAQRAEMLATAIEQGVIDEAEGRDFAAVHAALDVYLEAQGAAGTGVGAIQADGLVGILEAMVKDGVVTADESTLFLDVHERLISAGLME